MLLVSPRYRGDYACSNSSTLGIACSRGEAPPATCAGGALNCNASFNVIDVLTGIGSFTDAFSKIPEAVMHAHYWIENNPTAVLSPGIQLQRGGEKKDGGRRRRLCGLIVSGRNE